MQIYLVFVLNHSSRPWLCYWMVHPLALLDEVLDDDLEDDIVNFLGRCQVC
jgi:protein farnesyltransferase subunit beta